MFQVDRIIEVQVTKMVKDEYGASKTVEKTIDAVQHDVSDSALYSVRVETNVDVRTNRSRI